MISDLLDSVMDVAEDAAEIGEAVGILPPGTADAVDTIDDALEDVVEIIDHTIETSDGWGGVDHD